VPPAWREEWRDRFRALESPRFRLFWTGHAVSVVGTWIQSVALYWLMFRLTRSPLLLGLTGLSLTLPVLCFTLLGGALADRMDRRRLVRTTQALNLMQAGALAAYVTFADPRPEVLLAFAFAGGTISAFDLPARQSFLSELVPAAHLTNAIALNSMVFNAARLTGPAIAGVVLVRAGEAACFWLNALSFVPLLWNLGRFPPGGGDRPAPRQTTLGALREGLRYAWSEERIRNLLVLMLLAGSLGFQYVVLLPIYAEPILHSGARGYSLLMAAAGVGALTASLTLTARFERGALRRALFAGLAVFGSGLILFSLSRTLWLSAALSAFIGLGMILYAAGTNTLLQTAVRDEYRGRVMGLFTLALIGTSSIGSLVTGAIGERFGAPTATRVAGTACLLGAAWVAHRLRVLARREADALAPTSAPPSS
jgi:MFS family permease